MLRNPKTVKSWYNTTKSKYRPDSFEILSKYEKHVSLLGISWAFS
jgi:hypothetical protein